MLLLAAYLLLAAADGPAVEACRADLQSSYRTEENFSDSKDKIFVVEISSPSPCAKVYFDLLTTERLFNGEEIKTTTQNWRKVTAGAEPAFKLRFKMAKDTELIDWQIVYRSCVVCGN